MSLRAKLFVTFAILLLLVGVQGGITVFLLTQVVESSALLVGPALVRIDKLAHMDSDLLRLRSLEHFLIMSASPAERQQYSLEMGELRVKSQQRLQEYKALDLDEERAGTGQVVGNLLGNYLTSQSLVAERAQKGDSAGALNDYMEFQPEFQQLESQVHNLRHLEYTATEALRDRVVLVAAWVRWPLAAIVLLAALTEVALGWYISKSIGMSLDILEQGTRRIAAEDFSLPVPPPPEKELTRLAIALNGVMKALENNKAEKARLEEERLRLMREQLSRVVRAQEEERGRVSRELHDQAGQALTALQYGLTRIHRLTRSPVLQAEIDSLLTLVADASQRLRSLARDLRPAVLDDLGLVPALRTYSREFSERIAVPIEFSVLTPVPRMSTEAETTVFRVVQEALTNVGKHAHASHAWVTLDVRDSQLRVLVRDDGLGFNLQLLEGKDLQLGLGLAGIRERVQLLGGVFSIASEPGKGTQLDVSVPAAVNGRGKLSNTKEVAV